MQTREEVIRAFFDDDEKMKAVANDEEFISKVSEGKATAETYKEEFKKFGLDLTDEEAVQTAKAINKIRNNPPNELNDLSLENIGGGIDTNDNEAIQWEIDRKAAERRDTAWMIAGSIGGGIAAVGAITIFVGGVCDMAANFKAFGGALAKKRGNTKLAAEYYTKAKKLAWMVPKDKAYYDSKLKELSR